MASIAAGIARFASFLIPAVAAPLFTLHFPAFAGMKPYDFIFTWAQPVAVLWLIIMTAVNYLGVRLGGAVQVVLTIVKIVSVLVVIGMAFFSVGGSAHPADPIWPAALNGGILTAFLAALAAALWAYDGWEDLNLVGSEVANPQKNFPRALIVGVLFCSAIFMLFSAAAHWVLPFSAVAQSEHVASDVVASISGRNAALWVTLAMAVSALGTLNASTLSGARVPYAMARDGIFF